MTDSSPFPPHSFENLYLHVPFCRAKCAYCAFYSQKADGETEMRLWLKHLTKQLQAQEASLQHLHTIYIGGGTPTLLPYEILENFLQTLKRHTHFSAEPSVSIESNPETVNDENADLLSRYVTRVTMGIESFHPQHLKTIGRATGTPEAAFRAADCFRKAGIRNLGFDLIYAIPGQTAEDFLKDLQLAVSLNPCHISAYSLTLEEGSRLAADGTLQIPDDRLNADLWNLAGHFLGSCGMPRYEISNYADDRHQALHNQNVWHGETYLGLGPSAASFDGQLRWTEKPSLFLWLQNAPPEKDVIPRWNRIHEIFIMGLRTARGWTLEEFLHAVPDGAAVWEHLMPLLQNLSTDDLVILSETAVKPTQKGMAFWDDIAEYLLPG